MTDPSTAVLRQIATNDNPWTPPRPWPAKGLAQSSQVEIAAKWSRWDWIKWGAPWLTLGVVLGAIMEVIIRLRF